MVHACSEQQKAYPVCLCSGPYWIRKGDIWTFCLSSGFRYEQFFKDYYGVLCGTTDKAERIVIRAYPPFTHYLRTLPLHHSQKELKNTEEYADFEFYLRPTFDFRQELLSQGHEVEVLKPDGLRQEMKKLLAKMMERYG